LSRVSSSSVSLSCWFKCEKPSIKPRIYELYLRKHDQYPPRGEAGLRKVAHITGMGVISRLVIITLCKVSTICKRLGLCQVAWSRPRPRDPSCSLMSASEGAVLAVGCNGGGAVTTRSRPVPIFRLSKLDTLCKAGRARCRVGDKEEAILSAPSSGTEYAEA
jgi:hypothetical protein